MRLKKHGQGIRQSLRSKLFVVDQRNGSQKPKSWPT
jgi:hypothetical protein